MSAPPAAIRPGAGQALRALALPTAEIEQVGIRRLREQTTDALPPPPADEVALRMAYAAGDPSLLAEVVASREAVSACVAALGTGAPLICDVGMVRSGMRGAAARLGSPILVAVDSADRFAASGTLLSDATRAAIAESTRSARAIAALADRIGGSVAVIGNAPTALLALLDMLGDGVPAPEAVIATCCGLVSAAEAKELLLRTSPCPVIAVRGSRGGSAVAAAAVNACCRIAAGDPR
ncbi:MAG: precorrin-8X methylmutase [Chloroflexi bacterium]|nr:MAG: precorrin-8X methylmutase [Chloroflexota bacterium]